MELTLEKPEVLAQSPKEKPAKSYKMDMAFVQSYLRGEIYSDPTRAALQEYLSNARDTHTEIGRPDLIPQVIFSLPFGTQHAVTIRDFGLGIDPYRHDNFFAAYGCSTKRDTPDQMGKYGLGCKTAFADKSRDSFTVETVWRDGFDVGPDGEPVPMKGLFRRSYRHFINEDGLNNYETVFEEQLPDDSEEPTGTSIILPVASYELGKFYKTALEVTMFWKNPPELVNIREDWKIRYGVTYGVATEVIDELVLDMEIEGEGIPLPPMVWGTMKGTSSNFLVVDDIPYEVDGISDVKGVFIRCTNSDVKVTATREKLDLDAKGKTLPFVIQKFREVKSKLQHKIDTETLKMRGLSGDDLKAALKNLKNLKDSPSQRYITWYNEDAVHLAGPNDRSSVQGFVVQRHRVLELTAQAVGEEDPTPELIKDHNGHQLTEDDIIGNRVKFSISDYDTIYRNQFIGTDFVLLATGYKSEVRKRDALSPGKIEAAFLANPNAKYLLISKTWEGVQQLIDFKPVKMPKSVREKVQRTADYTFYYRKDNNLSNKMDQIKVKPGSDDGIMVCLVADYPKLLQAFNKFYIGYQMVLKDPNDKNKGYRRKFITGVGTEDEVDRQLELVDDGRKMKADKTLYFTRRKLVPSGFVNPFEILQVRMERLRVRIGDIPKKAYYSHYEDNDEWKVAKRIPFFGERLVPEWKASMVTAFNQLAPLLGEKKLQSISGTYDSPRDWELRQFKADKRYKRLSHRLRLVKPPRAKK